jgi:hypothetical protein
MSTICLIFLTPALHEMIARDVDSSFATLYILSLFSPPLGTLILAVACDIATRDRSGIAGKSLGAKESPSSHKDPPPLRQSNPYASPKESNTEINTGAESRRSSERLFTGVQGMAICFASVVTYFACNVVPEALYHPDYMWTPSRLDILLLSYGLSCLVKLALLGWVTRQPLLNLVTCIIVDQIIWVGVLVAFFIASFVFCATFA